MSVKDPDLEKMIRALLQAGRALEGPTLVERARLRAKLFDALGLGERKMLAS